MTEKGSLTLLDGKQTKEKRAKARPLERHSQLSDEQSCHRPVPAGGCEGPASEWWVRSAEGLDGGGARPPPRFSAWAQLTKV